MKFGKTKNVTWVDTGKGDVMSMRSERWSKRGSVILAFTNTKPGPIGKPRHVHVENWDEFKPMLVFEFKSAESIDALITSLKGCKQELLKK